MPEPFSAVVAVAGYSLLVGFQRNNTSVSPSGEYLRTKTTEHQTYARKPFSLDTRRNAALSALDELVQECCENGWDGEQAPAVTALTRKNVQAFLSAIPSDIPDPDFTPEPDNGSVSLEWYGGYRKIASVSIRESDRLAFASLHGTDVSSGAYRFSEEHIPLLVLTTIREILT